MPRPDDSSTYLADVTRLLWPGTNGAHEHMLALPSPGSPRMLVPVSPATVSAAGVRGLAASRTTRARIRRDVLAAGLRLGAGRVLVRWTGVRVPAGGIARHLGDILGMPLHVAVSIGPPRANRKPVVVLMRRDGRPAGYAKVGTNALTSGLVKAEASALQRLAAAPLGGLTVPRLLHRGTWNGLDLIVQEPLDTARAVTPHLASLVPAMRALSAVDGGHGPLSQAPAWIRTRATLATLSGPRAAQLRDRAATLEDLAGDVGVPFGAWHGDWTPWNTALRGTQAMAWDWERFAPGSPAGWDALHWSIHHAAGVRGLDLAEAARDTLDAASDLVAMCGGQSETAELVACAYFVEVGTRYLHDRQYESGADAGAVERWLTPALDAGLDRLWGAKR